MLKSAMEGRVDLFDLCAVFLLFWEELGMPLLILYSTFKKETCSKVKKRPFFISLSLSFLKKDSFHRSISGVSNRHCSAVANITFCDMANSVLKGRKNAHFPFEARNNRRMGE